MKLARDPHKVMQPSLKVRKTSPGIQSQRPSAISRANPMHTGVQAFLYDIRTSILPVVFIFNTELLLIGVTSIWHGLMVFVVSLIAILSFASLTQGWLLTRLSILERIVLAVVVVSLFRPDFLLNRVFPEYVPLEVSGDAGSQEALAPSGRAVRVHVTRETEYGPRYKLFVIAPTDSGSDAMIPVGKRIGATIAADSDGRLSVTNLDFNGPAEKVGLTFGDYITSLDVEQADRPPKEVVYPLGLLLLALVILLQRIKARATPEGAPGARRAGEA